MCTGHVSDTVQSKFGTTGATWIDVNDIFYKFVLLIR